MGGLGKHSENTHNDSNRLGDHKQGLTSPKGDLRSAKGQKQVPETTHAEVSGSAKTSGRGEKVNKVTYISL